MPRRDEPAGDRLELPSALAGRRRELFAGGTLAVSLLGAALIDTAAAWYAAALVAFVVWMGWFVAVASAYVGGTRR